MFREFLDKLTMDFQLLSLKTHNMSVAPGETCFLACRHVLGGEWMKKAQLIKSIARLF